VIDEADAVGDPDLPEPHALRELHGLLDARPLAVALGLDQRRLVRDAARLGIVVGGARVRLGVRVHLRRAETRTALGGLALAAGAHRGRTVGALGSSYFMAGAPCELQ